MKVRSLVPSLILSIGLVSACDAADAVDVVPEVAVRAGSGSSGGVWLNTSAIGTMAFSELDLDGETHKGIEFDEAELLRPGGEWLDVTEVKVINGNIRAKGSDGKWYVGADLVGSRWYLELDDEDDDDEVELRITSHVQISAKESRYVFQHIDDEGAMVPICGADADGSHTLIPVKDLVVDEFTGDMSIRQNTLYLACTSGAVGKAIQWGYEPWERTLAEFEAATRMIRADYCFDGTPWTENGTAIQVRDKWNINNFLDTDDPTEVVWTQDGAACMTTPRNPTYGPAQVTCDGQPLPTCPANASLTTYPGALFWTKLDA